KCDRGDRTRRVRAHARDLEPTLTVLREALIRDLLRPSVKISRARVIAQPGPGQEHLVLRSLGQSLDRRKFGDEILKKRDDGRDLGLLEHDLGDPNPVKARILSPRKDTFLALKPLYEASDLRCDRILAHQAGFPIS